MLYLPQMDSLLLSQEYRSYSMMMDCNIDFSSSVGTLQRIYNFLQVFTSYFDNQQLITYPVEATVAQRRG